MHIAMSAHLQHDVDDAQEADEQRGREEKRLRGPSKTNGTHTRTTQRIATNFLQTLHQAHAAAPQNNATSAGVARAGGN